jgi:hypothetical protein
MADHNQLLNTPISELGLTENFYLRSKLMGFRILNDIIRTPPEVLVNKTDFNFDWLGELSRFMRMHKLLHILQPIPGSNSF